MPTEFAWICDRFALIQENNGNAENSRRSGRIARKSSIYAERKKQAEELETKLQVRSSIYAERKKQTEELEIKLQIRCAAGTVTSFGTYKEVNSGKLPAGVFFSSKYIYYFFYRTWRRKRRTG
jgi:hypothetical protein